MPRFTKIGFFFLMLIISVRLFAQTPYTSQIFTATNFCNPAGVGFGVDNQFQTFYRSQFSGVGEPYKTIGVGADFALFRKEGYNNFGMGFQGMSEQILNGILKTNTITVSIADRIYLNKLKTSNIALGISSTLITRNLDRSALTFGDQYNSGRLFNTTSLETVGNFPTSYSTNAGIMYSFVSPESYLQLGGSTFYINRSSTSQTYGKVDQIFQFIGTLNYERLYDDNKTILFHADYQNRLETEYFYFGAALGLPMNNLIDNQNRMYFGCFYRTKDAIVPYVGMIYNKYKIGLTYDVYQSNMAMSSLHPQTFEFSLSTYLTHRLSENLRSLFN